MNSFEKYLPDFIKRSFRYGKFASDAKVDFVKKSEVPKSWFKHFYVSSSIISITVLHYVVNVYIFGNFPPKWLRWFLDENFGIYRFATVSPACVLLATVLITLQCLRRFYDTHFISIFAKNSRINFSHYFIGHAHYYGAILTIISEAPLFATSRKDEEILRWEDLNKLDLIASVIFLWAWYHQHKCTVILANLRKNDKGKIVTQEHKLPRGDWFEYVSAPHLLAEKLMYISLTVILWGNMTWFFVLAWVLSNQVETALLNHWWYQEKFGDKYPENRRAVIPFIY